MRFVKRRGSWSYIDQPLVRKYAKTIMPPRTCRPCRPVIVK